MIESATEAIIVYTPEKFLFLNEFERLREVGNPVAVEYLGEKKMIDLSPKPSRERPKKRK